MSKCCSSHIARDIRSSLIVREIGEGVHSTFKYHTLASTTTSPPVLLRERSRVLWKLQSNSRMGTSDAKDCRGSPLGTMDLAGFTTSLIINLCQNNFRSWQDELGHCRKERVSSLWVANCCNVMSELNRMGTKACWGRYLRDLGRCYERGYWLSYDRN